MVSLQSIAGILRGYLDGRISALIFRCNLRPFRPAARILATVANVGRRRGVAALLAGLRERSFQFLFLNGQKTHRIRFFLLVLLRSRLLGREKRPEI